MRNAEIDIERAISNHEARNTELRRLFVERKVDLGEARWIECHFWAWNREDAAMLARELTTKGFRILTVADAASPDDPALCNIEAEVRQSIELTLRKEFTDELVHLAASFHGVYDGWGTRI